MVGVGFAIPGYSQSWFDNGLAAYYPLNGNANDASGNGHNGVIHGSALSPATNQVGVANGAEHFGGGSYISVTPTPFNVNSNWTISFWCMLDANGGGGNFVSTGQDTLGGLNIRFIRFQGSTWQFGASGSGLASAATNNPNNWNMVTCLKNGSSYEMFLNDTLIGSNTLAGVTLDAGSLWFGMQPASIGWDLWGSLSDLRIYNVVLSTDEIQQLYQYESQSSSPACSPHGASATAMVVNGFVVGAPLSDGGCGYTNTPAVSFIGGGGNGATATAVVSNGVVVNIAITSVGTGYTSVPTVYIAPSFGWAPQLMEPPQALAVDLGSPAVFSVMASGASPLSYQWRKGGVNLTDGGRVSGSLSSTLILGATTAGDAGDYTIVITNAYGSVTSGVAALTVLGAPVITTQPLPQTVSAGSRVVLSVTAIGIAPLTFQWTLQGTNLPGATEASLALTNVQFEQGGAYAVTVSNTLGEVLSAPVALAVLSGPRILSEPANQVGFWGEAATLQVAAEGTAPLTYQWFFDRAPIAWGTNASLSFSNLQLTNAGAYSVEVTNLYGSDLSDAATLIVNPAGVTLGLYAGLTLSGSVGKTFGIQYAATLNSTTNWTTLTNVTLTQPVELWLDTSVDVSHGGKRFYRVVAVP